MPRSRTILADLPLERRIFAVGAVAAANALRKVIRPKTAGAGDVLVSFANLGDQLRMLNVLSRFELAEGLDVVCNAGTEDAFSLYPVVRTVYSYANQGSGVLTYAARRAFTSSAPYARALVPQPFVTQPLALAAAKAFAARTLYCTPYGRDDSPGAIPLVRTSYRDAYEAFFSRALHSQPVYDRPQILADLHRDAQQVPPRVVIHFMTSAASRALSPSLFTALIDRLAPLGLQITVLGAKSEETQLRALLGARPVEYWCGRPLREVARLLAASRLFIGVDSSMMNLADAVGTPSVVLYARTAPHTHGPFYTEYRAIVPESGYDPVGVDTLASWKNAAPSGDISVESILNAAAELLR